MDVLNKIQENLLCLCYFINPQQNKSPPYNRRPSGIEAQSQGYNFPDVLEAHPIPNKNKADNFKKI